MHHMSVDWWKDLKKITKMDEKAYKLAKEAFVADLNGTNPLEIFLVFALMPGSQWLYSELLMIMEMFNVAFTKNKTPPEISIVLILFELVFVLSPTLIAMTATEYTLPMLMGTYAIASILWIYTRKHTTTGHRHADFHKYCRKKKMTLYSHQSSEISFITSFRAQIMLSTCIAILAVDFQIFPRRFAKTETFGYSIMDIGVGAFIMSSGLTSRYTRRQISSKEQKASASSSHPKSIGKMLYDFIRPVALVIVLGFVRFLTVKGVKYQEHVTEYGVHWNFYFTLAGVYFVFSILSMTGEWSTHPLAALFLLLVYQIFLSYYGGENYIIHARRDNLFSQNREGILSLAGYTSLYIFSVCIGRTINGYMYTTQFRPMKSLRMATQSLFFLMVGAMIIWLASTLFFSIPSRRMVNFSYVFWVIFECIYLLFVYASSHLLGMLPRVPIIFQGTSRNQLFLFLMANLITGAVNLSMRTIYATSGVAFAVLFTYVTSIGLLAAMLQYFNIRIRL